MVGEEAAHEADLVSDEKAEAKTKQTRGQGQPAGKLLATLSYHRERSSNAHGDEHHAGDGAYAEDQQVSDCPMHISDRGQDQQRHSRGTGETVNDSNHKGPKILIEADSSPYSIHPRHWHRIVRVGMSLRLVSMGMVMNVVSVAVGVGVNDFLAITRYDRSVGQGVHEPGHVDEAQDNQHDGDGKLHAESDPHGNDEIKQNDSGTDGKDGKSVAHAPECPDQSRPRTVALIADDGCDGNDVVRISGVAHP